MNVYRKERGAVTIIEAAFVFPIMFFIVFFMIMAGEGFYQFARVEYAITSAAVSGAARCENPMLGEVIKKNSVPTDPTAVDVVPYRYILTGEADKIAGEVAKNLRDTINSYKPLVFRNMSPKIVTLEVKPHMNALVSSLEVKCTFDVPFPIRMVFTNQSMDMSYTVQMSAPVGDPAEFVRNVGMIKDVIERSKVATDIMNKLGNIAKKVGDFTN